MVYPTYPPTHPLGDVAGVAYIDGVTAMELLQSCIKSSIYNWQIPWYTANMPMLLNSGLIGWMDLHIHIYVYFRKLKFWILRGWVFCKCIVGVFWYYWAFLLKLSSDECHWISVMLSQHYFKWWFCAVRQPILTYLASRRVSVDNILLKIDYVIMW